MIGRDCFFNGFDSRGLRCWSVIDTIFIHLLVLTNHNYNFNFVHLLIMHVPSFHTHPSCFHHHCFLFNHPNNSLDNDDNNNNTIPHTTQHSKKPYGPSCISIVQIGLRYSGILASFSGKGFVFPKHHLHKDKLQECLTRSISAIKLERMYFKPVSPFILFFLSNLLCYQE